MKKDIKEILYNKAEEFKKRGYLFFNQCLSEAYCFDEKINGINYRCEIHVIKNKNNKEELLVMFEVSQKRFLIGFVGIAKYFAISKNNFIRDLKNDEVFYCTGKYKNTFLSPPALLCAKQNGWGCENRLKLSPKAIFLKIAF